MKSELILNSDVLDIIFENKNKAYGAYNLRKYYNNRLYKSMAIMFGLAAVFTAFSFIPKNDRKPQIIYTMMPLGSAPIEKQKEKEKPKTETAVKPQASQRLPSIVTIVPDNTLTDTLHTFNPDVAIGLKNVPADSTGGGTPGPGNGEGGGNDTVAAPATPPTPAFNPDIPLESPEIMPSYPGGNEALRKFLQKNLVNPKEMEEGELVKVVIRFVVNQEGKLKSFDVVQDGGEEFNKEVIRVLKKMPAWIPGKSNGRDVSVYYSIPIKFVPNE